MTPRVYDMKPGGVVLSLATGAMIGVSFSEDVWSQIARFAARDPGVRSGSGPAGVWCRVSPRWSNKSSESGGMPFKRWHPFKRPSRVWPDRSTG